MRIRTWMTGMCVAASIALFAGTSPALAKPAEGSTKTTVKAKTAHHGDNKNKIKTTKKKSTATHTQHKAKTGSSTQKSKKP